MERCFRLSVSCWKDRVNSLNSQTQRYTWFWSDRVWCWSSFFQSGNYPLCWWERLKHNWVSMFGLCFSILATSDDGNTPSPEHLSRHGDYERIQKLPSFTGSESWKVWFNHFDDEACRRNWLEKKSLDVMLPRLKGPAGEYVYDQLSCRERTRWKELVDCLKKRFRKVESRKMFSRYVLEEGSESWWARGDICSRIKETSWHIGRPAKSAWRIWVPGTIPKVWHKQVQRILVNLTMTSQSVIQKQTLQLPELLESRLLKELAFTARVKRASLPSDLGEVGPHP